MQKLLLFGILFLGMSACGGQENGPVKEEQKLPVKGIKYYVRYLDVIKEVQMEAKFLSDSSSFLIPDGVFVNEDKMKVKQLPRIGWQHKLIKKPSTFDTTYVFSFNISPSQTHQDSLEFKVLGNLRLATPDIKKSTGGLIQWEGLGLDSKDALTLLIEDSQGNPFTINHVGLTRGSKLEIRPDLIQAVAPGIASLRLIYKRREQLKKDGIAIDKHVEYYFRPIKFEISE